MVTTATVDRNSAFGRRSLIWLAVAAESMTFLEHLDELRRRIVWSVVSVVVMFGVCWAFATELYAIASAPIRANPAVVLAVARPQDIFSLYVKVTLSAALFLSSPLVLTQAWLFISPGLTPNERRYAVPFVVLSSALFVTGGAFGYFVAFPSALAILLDWTTAAGLEPIIDASAYFDLFFSIVVAIGIAFQIPAVILVLSRVGLVTARSLAGRFKHAVVATVVVAAVVTPTSDVANMLLIAGPMIALYGVGIALAWAFGRRPISRPG